jgi:outer membrane protein, multidrug efflux system
MNSSKKIVSLFCLFLGLGCAVGPDYKKQDPSAPAQYGSLEKGISTGERGGSQFLTSWWKIFDDEILNDLIEKAVANNHDMRIAAARVRQARALSGVASSKLYPEGGATGAYAAYRRNETGFSGQTTAGGGFPSAGGGSGERQGELYQIGFDASWEIDIFGGVRREIEAAEAELGAFEEARRNSLITLQGETARNYIELRGQQIRLAITQKEVETRRQLVNLLEVRFQAGLINQLDLARARGELAAVESRVPSLENNTLAILHRLGVLVGQEPMALVDKLNPVAKLPDIPDDIPAGLPSDLLRRRPDIRKAERELAAATARIGVSTAELFPKFSLTGAFGLQNNRLDQLSREESSFWRIGPSFRWSILNLKRIMSNIEANQAAQEANLAQYEKIVLTSLEEVENSLALLSREKRRAEALGEAVQANRLALDLALERYKKGLESYLAVTDAESALYIAEDQLVQSRQNRALSFISLYKALGGGWEE